MKSRRFGVQLVALFAIVLVGYAVMYTWIEHRRVFRGPWAVTFASQSGVPALTVNQATLGIQDVRITFTGSRVESNTTQTVTFSQARPWPYEVPFGKCIFMDITFLPGTVALQMFGHEIQFMPRTLTIDKVERPWRSGETIELK